MSRVPLLKPRGRNISDMTNTVSSRVPILGKRTAPVVPKKPTSYYEPKPTTGFQYTPLPEPKPLGFSQPEWMKEKPKREPLKYEPLKKVGILDIVGKFGKKIGELPKDYIKGAVKPAVDYWVGAYLPVAEKAGAIIKEAEKGYQPTGDRLFNELSTKEKAKAFAKEFASQTAIKSQSVGMGQLSSVSTGLGFLERFGWDKAKSMADKTEEWSRAVAPENPDFADTIASGIGSMSTFYLPGFGVAKGTSLLAGLSPKIANIVGNSAMTLLESGMEAGGVYRDLKKQGVDDKTAKRNSDIDFGVNVVLLALTNRFNFVGNKSKSILGEIKNRLLAGGREAIQELGQQIAGNIATYKNWDDGVKESAGVGGLLGFMLGGSVNPNININVQTQKEIINLLSEAKKSEAGFAKIPFAGEKSAITIPERKPLFDTKPIPSRIKILPPKKQSIPTIAKKMTADDKNIMTDFIDTIRLRKKANVDLEIKARRTGEAMGLNVDVPNYQLANKFDEILEVGKPKFKAKDIIDEKLIPILRGTKGLTAEQITKKYPDIQLKRDVPAKDIYGNKVIIPDGEALTPYELTGNKILLQDGETYIVSKNQFANIKGQSISGEVKEFAPELKGTKETINVSQGKDISAFKTRYNELAEKRPNATSEELNKITAEQDKIEKTIYSDKTKYSQYQLPDGKNYEEILIKAPDTGALTNVEYAEMNKISQEIHGRNYANLTAEQSAEAAKLRIAVKREYAKRNPNKRSPIEVEKQMLFKSAHWDEPNVISHLRMNERTYKGKKVSFMEELQSDWAKEGRDKGFLSTKKDFTIEKTGKNTYEASKDEVVYGVCETEESAIKEAIIAFDERQTQKVPNNPLLKNWQEPTIKRALQKAVSDKADYFAWINGEQTSARYNLATYVNEVEWFSTANGKGLSIRPKTGSSIDIGLLDKNGVIKKADKAEWQGKKLDEVLGKGLADKIMEKETGNLSGEGLKFGGEWAENLYDKQVKNIVEDLTGGKVIKMDMGLLVEKGKTGGWSFQQGIKLTPEIKAKIKGEAPQIKTSGKMFEAQKPKFKAKKEFKISDNVKKDIIISDNIYKENRESKIGLKQIVIKDVKETLSSIKLGADKYLGAISTRLKNINPELKRVLRTFEYNIRQKSLQDTIKVKPFLETTKKMSKADYSDFDLARKNGDKRKIQSLIIKYRIGKEYNALRKTLDDLYKRAQEVGYKIGYKESYHPRIINDVKGFLNYFQRGNNWNIISQAITAKENALARYLNEEEKSQLINTMIRGYQQNNIALSEIGNMKSRVIDVIDADLNQFYMDSNSALLSYITKANETIETRKFFGKGMLKEGVKIDDSIGNYILKLLQEGKINPDQEVIVSDILKARFKNQGTRGIISTYKNLSYIDTMGSVISTITQLGDLTWSLYKAGFIRTTKGIIKSITRKVAIKKEDIGITRIAEEFSDPTKSAKAVSDIFGLQGLTKIDTIGKETLIDAVISKYQSWAKTDNKRLTEKLTPVFGNDKKVLQEVVDDLKSGDITENVKLLAFNELADVQPILLSEMPQKYLTGGNGRLFYMLKTFTLKQFDIYRNEIYQKIAKKGTRIEGIKNLVSLLALFILMNATADEIKDFILNRKTSLKDRTVDNILRAVGFSKYLTWKVRTEGLGSGVARQILPPFKFIDSVSKDILKGIENGSEITRSVPIGGKLYYWWFGKGAYKTKLKEPSMTVPIRTRKRRVRRQRRR